MYETTVGQLPPRRLEYSYSSTPFTDTIIFTPSSSQAELKQDNLRTDSTFTRGSSKDRFEDTENLDSEDEYLSAAEYDLDMGELSDSRSSVHTTSRPVTPSQPNPSSGVINITRDMRSSKSKSTSPSHSPPTNSGVYTLAHKAERILGLIPGTLAHARACLDNARDEVRRTAEIKSPTPEPYIPSSLTNGNGQGMKDRIHTRARKAMSVAGFPGYGGKVPGVVVGTGGRDEEERREKRRKAADGVLHWQREVERLEKEDHDSRARR